MKKLILLPLLCLTLAAPVWAGDMQQKNGAIEGIPVKEEMDRLKSPEFWKNAKKLRTQIKKNDQETFDEFAFLGIAYCFDKLLPFQNSLAETYSNGFNGKSELFPRVISYDHLMEELGQFHKQNFPYKNYYGFFDGIKKCQAVYHIKNKKLRQTYDKIINNPNYLRDWEFMD